MSELISAAEVLRCSNGERLGELTAGCCADGVLELTIDNEVGRGILDELPFAVDDDKLCKEVDDAAGNIETSPGICDEVV